MAHLIDHLSGPAAEVLAGVRVSHDTIVADARSIAANLSGLPGDVWGVAAKRITADAGTQPLGELVNQLATVERLTDVLVWVIAAHGPGVEVAANPTTTSIGSDLTVGVSPRWCIEVSDVTRAGNANGKLDKDLNALGRVADADPSARCFLAMSPEWIGWLSSQLDRFWTRRGWQRPDPADVHDSGGPAQTGIIEVRRIPTFG